MDCLLGHYPRGRPPCELNFGNIYALNSIQSGAREGTASASSRGRSCVCVIWRILAPPVVTGQASSSTPQTKTSPRIHRAKMTASSLFRFLVEVRNFALLSYLCRYSKAKRPPCRNKTSQPFLPLLVFPVGLVLSISFVHYLLLNNPRVINQVGAGANVLPSDKIRQWAK